jgi:hypothetical protein
MDVKALILVGGREDGPSYERMGGVPFALLDVLGEPVLGRVLKHLERVGVSGAAVVSDVPPSAAPLARGSLRPDLVWTHGMGPQFWRAAEAAFSTLAQAGGELVVVVRIGAYAEVDYEDLIQCHLDKRNRVTSALDEQGVPLDIFVISASRRNDAAFLFRHELRAFREEPEECRVSGYVNRLQHAADFRRLALDCFAGVASFRPIGKEIKPGVWSGEGARIHKSARVLAPAFIGARSNVRALSVITRGSVLEHHAVIDCGTVVENSTVLPQTAVGAALDVAHSVVGLQRINNLRRRVEIEIVDTKLIDAVSSAPVRALSSAVGLALFFPKSIMRGLWPRRRQPATLPEALNEPSAALQSAQLESEANSNGEFSPNLVVARRYGNE